MADAQVTCINKQPRIDPHEGITHLGGSSWKWTRQQVITSIEQTNTFYTMVGGKRADVGGGERPKRQVRQNSCRWVLQRQSAGTS